MSIKVQTIWVPRTDITLAGVNSALRVLNLSPDQIDSFVVTQAGPEYRKVLLSYQDSMPPVLIASDIRDGAWFHADYPPSRIRLLFNVPIQKSSVGDTTFRVVKTSSTTNVTASGITFSGQELTIPVSLTGYEGPVTIIGSGFSSQDGAEARQSISVSFMVGTASMAPLPQAPSNTLSKLLRRGQIRASKIVAVPGMETKMVETFRRYHNIPEDNVLETISIGSESNTMVETYVLWYERTAPSISAIAPAQSLVPSEIGMSKVHLTFDQPVSDLTTSEAVLSAPIGVSYGIVQTSTDKTQWELTGNFSVPGQYTLRLVGVRDRNGDSLDEIDYYGWQVMPTEVGGSTPAQPFCDAFTGTGAQSTFALSETPIACSYHVFRNGVSQLDCVAVVGNMLTFSDGPPNSGDKIIVRGWYQP